MLAADTRAARLAKKSAFPPRAPFWKDIVSPVAPFLRAVSRRLAEQVEEFEPDVTAHARYALTSQGKQLRPALMGLSALATGGLNDQLVTAATVVEMVHLATLVHDDVIDKAEVRRRRPTLAATCGNSISVLLGDCLFAHAVKLAASFPTPDVCRAVAAATKTVCSGEILQTQSQRDPTLARSEYFRILRMKTAELFALSCDLGAWLSGAGEQARCALRTYGMELGTAYQVYDDCLDVFGSEASAGKSLGSDLAGGKPTLPVIAALEKADDADRKTIEQMLRVWNPQRQAELLGFLHSYGSHHECSRVIRELSELARQALAPLAASEGLDALLALASFLAQQTEALGVGI